MCVYNCMAILRLGTKVYMGDFIARPLSDASTYSNSRVFLTFLKICNRNLSGGV